MMCIVIIAQYADCTPCGFGSRQKVRSVVHPRAAILHFELWKNQGQPAQVSRIHTEQLRFPDAQCL